MVVRAALPRCTQKPAGCNRGSGMQWGRALLITSTARGTWTPESEAAATHAHTCRREARACAGLRGPGFAAGAEIAVLMPVPAGAGLLAMVPAGVLCSAGESPWPGPQRLGAALKQVFILEFDRRNAPIIIKWMHTQVTKKHASECTCCVQLGVR